MQHMTKLGAVFAAAAALAAPQAFADGHENAYVFQKAAEKKSAPTLSKAEVQKMMEKAFDKVDTERKGKLDKKQLEHFLAEFARMSGG